jgi:hypothetical protein
MKHKKILAAIVAALPTAASAAGQPGDWDVDTAVLYYSESERVQAIEPVIQATRYFNNDRSFTTKLVIDSLSGASATGAVPSSTPQTYSRPSGNGSYTIAANQTPLDDTFLDTRIALSGGWKQPLGKDWTANIGFNVSNEYDYLSAAVNGGISREMNDNNTTLSLGFSFASDSISPEGGIPIAGTCMVGASQTNGCTQTQFNQTRQTGDESKTVSDLVFGVSQIINRTTVLQMNYSFSQSSGYLTDPFKLVSVIDTDNSAGNGIGEAERHIYENRSDSRTKHGLTTRLKKYLFDKDVLDASYRYMFDDWGMNSHTLDVTYRWAFGKKHSNRYLKPHIRWYEQQAVDFYMPFLLDNQALPAQFTADYRQGDLTGVTLGFEYGWQTQTGNEIKLAFEYYNQSTPEPSGKIGQLQQQTLATDLDAIMMRFHYNFDF